MIDDTEQPETNIFEKAAKAGYPEKPLNKDSWEAFICDNNYSPFALIGYQSANEDLTDEINRIVENASDFSELKKELLAFIDDRRAFNLIVEENWDQKRGHFKGFTNS